MCFFSLVAFKIFILYLVFSKLIMMYLGICFIGFILFSVCWSFELLGLFFSHIWEVFSHCLLKEFQQHTIFFFLFEALIIQILDLQLVFHRFFFIFSCHLFLLFILDKFTYSSLLNYSSGSLFFYWALSNFSIWFFLTSFIFLLRLAIFTLISRVLVTIC